MLHILVTGGAGFIGSHIVEHHMNKGDKVYVIDDLSTGSTSNIAPFFKDTRFRFAQADILTWSELDKAVAWADRIYHMAAVVGVRKVLAEPIKVLATNIAGCERLLRAVHKNDWKPAVITASTSEVYGCSTTTNYQEDADLIIKSGANSRWNYAISKLADEALALSYHRKYDLPITVVRFFNTIGPRQTGRYGMVVPKFIEQASQGEPITVYGDGLQTRCFCDVRDTVTALDLLAETADSRGEIVNVGNDREISILSLAKLINELAGNRSPIQFLSYQEAYGEDFDDIRHRRPNLNKLVELTGFWPQWQLKNTLIDLLKAQSAPTLSLAG